MPYRLLSDMGLREWQEKINQEKDSGLDVTVGDRSLLIQKRKNAPAELPYSELLSKGSILERVVSF